MYFLLGKKEFALFFVLAQLVAAAEHKVIIEKSRGGRFLWNRN